MLFIDPLSTVVAAALLAGAPEGFRTYDVETFFDTTSYRGASFSADERFVLFTSDASGVFNAYRQPLDGGPAEMLTHSDDDAISTISWFPEDDRFLTMSDQGGNELTHLFVHTPDGARRDLTPGEGHRATFVGWARDRRSFFVMTNERNPQSMDLYRYDVTTYARELLYRNDAGYTPAGVSGDGSRVALLKVRNNADNDLYIIDVTAGDGVPRHITPHDGSVNFAPQGFSADGATLYYTCNRDSEWERLWAYDLATDAHALVREADWDIAAFGESFTGRYQVVAVNADARTDVTIIDTTTGTEVVLPGVPRGDITGGTFSRSEKLVAFYVSDDTAPANLYVMALDAPAPTRLTDALTPRIDARHLVESEVVRYPSFDGLEIPALLFRPHQASAATPVPAVVWVHGGPGGQSRTGYSAFIQYLVNHGYAVLAVNNRGSSGYGKTFFHLDDRNHGEGDLQDCIHGRRYLESLDWVDGDRVAILGGSYGGYMVAAALAFEPDAFDVGIDIFGVTNWLRTLQSIPPWWADFREALYAELGDPATDEERLRRISPLFHASNIRKPLLVIQGANDPRVLKVESDELVETVRESGVPVEYVVFDDEGHGFSKKANRITAIRAIGEFLDRYMSTK
ncbi:MAG: S9 family peptidase [Phycisphaerales bacterium]|nr:S9 family peptidase [Phycisphaerales bacterium]